MPLTPEEQATRRAYLRDHMTKTPYIEGLGIVIERWDEDLAFSEIRVADPDDRPIATGTLVYRIVP